MNTQDDARRFDVLFHNATLVDGTGNPRRKSDVAVSGDRIVAIGDLSGAKADVRFDLAGKVLAPGFIDVHTHDDALLLEQPEMTPKVSQGVTTVVTGNCGVSLAPLVCDAPPPPLNLFGGRERFRFAHFAEYLTCLKEKPAATNVLPLVGHSTLRVATMPELDRPADDGERTRMKEILEESMAAGARGFSTGLYYDPAKAAPATEVDDLLPIVSAHGGIYTTHMRNEDDGVEDSIRESVESARKGGVRLVISHHKCAGVRNHGRSEATLRAIDAADAAFDIYPFIASSTILMPNRADLASKVLITFSQSVPEAGGRDLDEIATEWGCSRKEAMERLVPGGGVYFMMAEEDVRRILSHPRAMIGSDGLPHDTCPHPRLWATFPRVLGHYARDVGLFPLEDAVRKMTSLSAATFGLTDRGIVREGAFADLVVFDPDTIAEGGTFTKPAVRAHGIDLVMVNGEIVSRDGAETTNRPGRVL